MATGTLVSVQEYLKGDFEVDCDYVDGVLEERNVGEHDHTRLQLAIAIYFGNHEEEWGIRTFPEQRVQVGSTRYRVPDVCVMQGTGPFTPILRTPPLICVEILSPEDRLSRVQKRMEDYLNFGVPNVWLIDPETRQAFIYTPEGSYQSKDGVLRTENPKIFLDLAVVFEKAGPPALPDGQAR